MYTSDHIGALQQAGIPLMQVWNENDYDSWRAALADPAGRAAYVVAMAGDPVSKAVAKASGGLTELTVLCTTGQPCARIYRSDRFALPLERLASWSPYRLDASVDRVQQTGVRVLLSTRLMLIPCIVSLQPDRPGTALKRYGSAAAYWRVCWAASSVLSGSGGTRLRGCARTCCCAWGAPSLRCFRRCWRARAIRIRDGSLRTSCRGSGFWAQD